MSDVQSIEYTNYPLTLAVALGSQLRFTLTYDARRFPAESMERALLHLRASCL